MATDCPNGFFKDGLLIYGQGLDPFVPVVVSKGFLVECPDRANASDQFNTDFHGQVRRLLHMLGGQYRMQLCWSVDSNYQDELVEYARETERDCPDPYLLDYSITTNLYPADKDKVVGREQEKLRRVRGDYASTRNPEFLEAMGMIEERIKSIKRGSVNPYEAEFIIRIWATTPEELADKTQILRTVINRLDGCKEHEPLTFSTNKQLWFQSWPGWIFGKYTHQAKYFEDIDLASMLPFSSTFTGHLKGAEILHAGANRSVVGISLTDRITLFELSLLGSGESPMKTAAYYLISNACRKHVMTLPRQLLKRGLIEEAARVADIPDGAAMMEEMAAQLRKYNCWACFAFQNDAQLEKEKVRKVIFGNIKQALLGRQRSPKLVRSIAQELELPEAAAEAISRYPLPEHIAYAYSQFLYYHMDANRPLCGTISVTKNLPYEPAQPAVAVASPETST